jgi:TonB family protein
MDCKKFEHMLWENPFVLRQPGALPPDMAEHVDSCAHCGRIFDDFIKLMSLSKKSEIVKNEVFWEDFDNMVWDKIGLIETADESADYKSKADELFARRSTISFKQLAASLTVAAAAVIFMLMAVSDITKKIPQSKPVPILKGNEYSSFSPYSQNAQKGLDIILSRPINDSLDVKDFSILPQPEISIVSDSALVTIDAAYLTDEGLDEKTIRVARASSNDIVMRTKKVDTSIAKMRGSRMAEAPAEWVISVEKMPKMIEAVPPTYPPLAYKLKKSGEVWVKAKIDVSGKVESALIYKDSGTDYGFEDAALKAAYKNEFEPFEVDGTKVPIWVIYKVRFVARE